MVVTILRQLSMADAGRARVLDLGQSYDLPEVVASRLVSRGAAVLAEPAVRAVAAVVPAESGQRRQRGRA